MNPEGKRICPCTKFSPVESMFVAPMNKRKQKEVDKSEIKSVTSKAESSKKSEGGRSVKKSQVVLDETQWAKTSDKDKTGRILWQCKRGNCQAKYRSDDRWKHIC